MLLSVPHCHPVRLPRATATRRWCVRWTRRACCCCRSSTSTSTRTTGGPRSPPSLGAYHTGAMQYMHSQDAALRHHANCLFEEAWLVCARAIRLRHRTRYLTLPSPCGLPCSDLQGHQPVVRQRGGLPAERAGRHRRRGVGAALGLQPHHGNDGGPQRLVHQPPAQVGCAHPCLLRYGDGCAGQAGPEGGQRAGGNKKARKGGGWGGESRGQS